MTLACYTLLATAAHGFNGEHYTVEPITVAIGEMPVIGERGAPVAVTVTVNNLSDDAVDCVLHTRMTDGWTTQEPDEIPLTVPANGEATTELHVICPEDAYSAHYPLHVTAAFDLAGERTECHAVQVFETKLPTRSQDAGEWETLELVDGGTLRLTGAKSWLVRWQYQGGEWVDQPPNWQGSEPRSRASVGLRTSMERGGVRHEAINMHPPWTGGVGTVTTVFKVKLATTPAKLQFYTAIRDHTKTEPPSDGVLFRVWADDGTGPEMLFERFSDAKAWEPGEVDLAAYVNKTIELALESHPGPHLDTTCDSSYWGDPALVSGERPEQLTAQQRLSRFLARSDTMPIPLGEGNDSCRLSIGENGDGLLGADLMISDQTRRLLLAGFDIEINGESITPGASNVECQSVKREFRGDPLTWIHEMVSPDWQATLTVGMTRLGDAVRFDFECDQPITRLSVGAFNEKAERYYFGHGNVVEDPEYFRIGAGGHGLATSYIGCDFEGGMSLVQACDPPPDYCEARPEERAYPLVTHHNCSLWLVPSTEGCFDAAMRLPEGFKRPAAGGVAKAAGRFVFDVWGGTYADIAADMQQAARYGLTDSMLLVHNWQRWGYDYRLPDIWPPNPRYGTLEDMQRIGEVCGEHGILWGPHDNYIDIYPDAEEFSYDHVYFTALGQPHKAWFNKGREARSYKFRPDHIMRFVQRNLKLIREGVAPTAYFIDVFAAAPVVDYYDREGGFHPKTETQRCWGEVFAWIRDYLGGDAPQMSEAGDDHLIGWLDGADAQMLRLSTDRARYARYLVCADWERTPWFNAVWHDRFILHGVGYSGRYQGGLPFASHGIYSDDYISAEVLCGNAGMVHRSFDRDWVRKYWLIQPLMRSLALQTIAGHEFAGDDIHRQTVTWSNGATVHVNRGEDAWSVEGHDLPQYGFIAGSGDITCAIERLDGIRVAHASAPDYLFVDARGMDPDSRLPISVRVAGVERLGERRFRIDFEWDAERPADKDYGVFVHFCSERSTRSDGIAFQGDHAPDPPTSQWQRSPCPRNTWVASMTSAWVCTGTGGRGYAGTWTVRDGRSSAGWSSSRATSATRRSNTRRRPRSTTTQRARWWTSARCRRTVRCGSRWRAGRCW
jgi:hypothetical protein